MACWLDQLLDLIGSEPAVARVTILGADAPTPREIGSTMLVTAAGTFGRIGRGPLEVAAVEAARKMIAERGERGSAAVLSPRAADLFGLEVLAADIQSEPLNRTRFLVIAPPGTAVPGTLATSMHSTLLVAVRNEPGTLVRVLLVLADHGLNMTKLESRPSRTSTWEYVFWIDVDADMSAPEQAAALAELEASAVSVRVLGSYTKALEPG